MDPLIEGKGQRAKGEGRKVRAGGLHSDVHPDVHPDVHSLYYCTAARVLNTGRQSTDWRSLGVNSVHVLCAVNVAGNYLDTWSRSTRSPIRSGFRKYFRASYGRLASIAPVLTSFVVRRSSFVLRPSLGTNRPSVCSVQ